MTKESPKMGLPILTTGTFALALANCATSQPKPMTVDQIKQIVTNTYNDNPQALCDSFRPHIEGLLAIRGDVPTGSMLQSDGSYNSLFLQRIDAEKQLGNYCDFAPWPNSGQPDLDPMESWHVSQCNRLLTERVLRSCRRPQERGVK